MRDVSSLLVLTLPDEAATVALAGRLAHGLAVGDVVTLAGGLGAGKTAFARALIRALTGNEEEEVPSPTFTLVQTYDTKAGPLWHFDLYRLKGADDVFELGWDEALAEAIVLVEWPDRLEGSRPPDRLDLTFEVTGPTTRRAILAGFGRWEARLAAALPS